MAPELNPLLAGDASAIITSMHPYLSGGKTAGAIREDIAAPRPSLVVENFRKALGLRVEAPPAEIAEKLSPFVGQGNGTVKLGLVDGTYTTS